MHDDFIGGEDLFKLLSVLFYYYILKNYSYVKTVQNVKMEYLMYDAQL